MQRLTENDGKGNWQLKGLPWEELAPGKELTAEASQLLYGALCKLKDLEDAGLHPKSAEAIDWLYLQKCKEVNELRKKTKWISVEERLPEKEYDTVLCVTDKNHYFVAVYNKEYGFRTGDIYAEGEVIAWMPRPEPYRPGRSEETWKKY